MTTYNLDDRLKENRATWTDYWKTFTIERFGATLALIALIVAVGGYINQHGGLVNLTTILGDFYANVSSELISIVITVLVVDRLNRTRELRDADAVQARLDEQELTRLKALLGSNEVTVSKIAVAELKAKGWLTDGALEDMDLGGANLAGANLEGANLSGVDLGDANLAGTKLRQANLAGARLKGADLSDADLFKTDLVGVRLDFANLSGARLGFANLSGAKLRQANLSNADLEKANLSSVDLYKANLSGADLQVSNLAGADLEKANLAGADLRYVNLEHANIYDIQCDTNTVLPHKRKWTEAVDWTKFGAVMLDWNEWEAYRKEQGLDEDK